ncbi:neuropeptide receptor 15-like [Tubulanus polymorphus]|uniref:neuropeptide receptor 15-like n=1 Tax=Tubulanus polymorphus TaxID=672921 RepID=UPI003DA2B376
MRSSVTNVLILNLAMADFFVMLFGIPDIIQFVRNRGWTLGQDTCRAMRYIMTSSVYASVMTLMALCVERYIAIVHPIKAHIMCSKKRILAVIACIWPLAIICCLPNGLYLVTTQHQEYVYCLLVFPGHEITSMMIYKYSESILFYVIPLVVQITLYSIIGFQLFAGTEKLHRRRTTKSENGVEKMIVSDAIKARKGVVKMLVVCIVVYFFCYSPNQILILYNTFADKPFHHTWNFKAFTLALVTMNSAANPIMYSIFSQNFRRKFKKVIMCGFGTKNNKKATNMDSFGGSRANTTRFTSLKTSTVTEM